jgi:hypothetical protein
LNPDIGFGKKIDAAEMTCGRLMTMSGFHRLDAGEFDASPADSRSLGNIYAVSGDSRCRKECRGRRRE